MKRILAASFVVLAVVALAAFAGRTQSASAKPTAGSLVGTGATFPFPLISRWLPAYERATGNNVTYNPIGSGGGISAITNRQVDFGASDAPLTPDQFTACKGCVQIPWVLSATSIAYNIPNAPVHLRITGQILAEIYLGNITNWNAPAIRRINPGVSLPDLKITPVFRSDGSGTTYNFATYLNTVSKQWKSQVGRGTTLSWPTGVGARGSSGVAGVISRTEGAIGYADIAYALKNKIKFFSMQNRSGFFARPGLIGIRAASLADRKFSPTNELTIVNPPPGKKFRKAYPICTYSYVLLRTKSEKASLLKPFVTWALTTGQQYGPHLVFSPVPPYVVARGKATLKKVHS